MRALLETSLMIELQRGTARAIAAVTNCESRAISVVTLGELEAGGPGHAISRMPQSLELLAVTAATAHLYGTIHQGLRRVGTPIPQNDLWIAATAIEHNLTLLTFDKHFSRVADLRSLIL